MEGAKATTTPCAKDEGKSPMKDGKPMSREQSRRALAEEEMEAVDNIDGAEAVGTLTSSTTTTATTTTATTSTSTRRRSSPTSASREVPPPTDEPGSAKRDGGTPETQSDHDGDIGDDSDIGDNDDINNEGGDPTIDAIKTATESAGGENWDGPDTVEIVKPEDKDDKLAYESSNCSYWSSSSLGTLNDLEEELHRDSTASAKEVPHPAMLAKIARSSAHHDQP